MNNLSNTKKYFKVMDFILDSYQKIIGKKEINTAELDNILQKINEYYIDSDKIINLPIDLFLLHTEILLLKNDYNSIYKLTKFLSKEKVLSRAWFIDNILKITVDWYYEAFKTLNLRILLLLRHLKILFLLEKDEEFLQEIKIYSMVINKKKQLKQLDIILNNPNDINSLYNANTILFQYIYNVLNIINKKKKDKNKIKSYLLEYIKKHIHNQLKYIELNVVLTFLHFISMNAFKNKTEYIKFITANLTTSELKALEDINHLLLTEW